MSAQNIEQEIQDLDREAREALDKLADKRDELERQHRATELAAKRQREREAERRLKEEREAQEREEARAREELREIGGERLRLEEEAELRAEALIATLGELSGLDARHRRALVKAGRDDFRTEIFSRTLGAWFRGRFNGAVPGIGFDPWDGKPLPERDPLTPEGAPKAAPGAADG